MAINFADALMEAKRRAQLQGRPLSQQESAGIMEGWAESAAERTARGRALDLQKQGVTNQQDQFSQQLAFEKQRNADQMRIAEDQMKRDRISDTAGGLGEAAGTGIGAFFGGPVGALIGGTLGKTLGGKCIIVTACTYQDSPEVEIARLYRDKFLDGDQLRGYYCLAGLIVPIMEKSDMARRIVKKCLVDRLIDYGSAQLGITEKPSLRSSAIVSRLFLAAIKAIGIVIPRYVRENGEVF